MPSPAASQHPSAPRRTVPLLLPVLVMYALLALLGGVLHRPLFSLIAAALLLLALGVGLLRRPSIAGAALWLLAVLLLMLPALTGRLQLALAGLPILILLAMAWVFARTLARGREPLIARCIRVIEGDGRLALPGVERYARGVTRYWAIVLGAQALILASLLVFARPGGLLDAFGVDSPLTLPRNALAWYPQAGCWAVLIIAFAAEYAFRRWHMRDVPHPPLKRFLSRLIRRWPQLIQDEVRAS